MTRRAVAAALGLGLLVGCGGGGGGNDKDQPNPCNTSGATCGALQLSVAAVNSAPAVQPLLALRHQALGQTSQAMMMPWQADSIVSGPPDEMRLYVKEILALGSSGRISVWTSSEARGTLLTLTSGTLDLGTALGATLSLPPGDYQGVQVVLSRVAEFKGCVSGTFRTDYPQTTATITASVEIGAQHVGNTYTNNPITDGAPHTFCTKAAWSELSVPTFSEQTIASNAQFWAVTTPELVEVDLARANEENLSADAIRAASTTIESRATFSVAADQQSRLTLAVDLNRQLRYFANTRNTFTPPNPNMKTGTSYFFTTIFPDTVMLFAGDAGSIQGYALRIQHDPGIDLAEWLTVIRNGDGAVVGGLVIPDDDNTLTIAKGSLTPPACVEQAGAWTLGFGLGTNGTGALLDFHFLDLNASSSCGLQALPHTDPNVPATGYTVGYVRKL